MIKSWTRLFECHLIIILLGKVWIRLFSFQIWVNSRTLVCQPILLKENSEFKSFKLLLKTDLLLRSAGVEGLDKYTYHLFVSSYFKVFKNVHIFLSRYHFKLLFLSPAYFSLFLALSFFSLSLSLSFSLSLSLYIYIYIYMYIYIFIFFRCNESIKITALT